jgi:hypothetical protein
MLWEMLLNSAEQLARITKRGCVADNALHHISEVLAITTDALRGLLQTLRSNCGIIRQYAMMTTFLPYPTPFIIHLSFYHSVL